MKFSLKKYKCLVALLTAALSLAWSGPVRAISIKEEHKLAREFMKYIEQKYEIIDDPAIVGYVDSVGKKILANMPPQPFDYHFYVVKEDVYNAFAIPAGHIFINSGLLAAMETEDELAGILGHEIAHVVARHLSKRIERSKKINIATMAGVVAGIFLGAAGGDPSAVQTLALGSAAAGQTAALAFSREDEAQSDQLGLEYVQKAGYDPAGLLSMLKKIRSTQWFGSDQIPTYMMTHPALEDRLVWVDSWSQTHKLAKNKKRSSSAKRTTAFRRINMRLKALHGDTATALRKFKTALKKNPKDQDMLYGYGLTLARTGKKKEAIANIKKALAQNALDPFILTDLGRIYFMHGSFQQAHDTLDGALSILPDNPDGLYYFGRAQVELKQLEAAVKTFSTLIGKYAKYKEAYYAIGEAYGRIGKIPHAHYYLGQYYYKKHEYRTAHFHLVRAQDLIKDKTKQDTVKKILKSIGPIPKKPEED